MNANLPTSVSDLWSLAGWTMVHFLWLGTIAAAVALAARTLLRLASPNIRYTAALVCLLSLAALPPITAAWLLRVSPPLKGGAGGEIVTSAPVLLAPVALPTSATAPNPAPIIELHNPTNELASQ